MSRHAAQCMQRFRQDQPVGQVTVKTRGQKPVLDYASPSPQMRPQRLAMTLAILAVSGTVAILASDLMAMHTRDRSWEDVRWLSLPVLITGICGMVSSVRLLARSGHRGRGATYMALSALAIVILFFAESITGYSGR
jgi:H+/Cl- antiporter ClcA